MSALIPAVRSAVQEAIGPALVAGQDLVLGPELLVNGDFGAGQAPWTVNNDDATHVVTFASGTMRYQSGTTSPQLNVQQAGVLVVGKKYQLVVEVSAYVSGAVKTDMTGASVALGTAPGTYIYRLTAANTSFNVTRSSANVDITIDKISIREVLST